MNIFEALEKGKGKAVISGCNTNDFYASFNSGIFMWKSEVCGESYIELHTLKRNDWEPYVPRETSTEGKCVNCMDKKPNDVVCITGQGKCIVCGKTPPFYPRVFYFIPLTNSSVKWYKPEDGKSDHLMKFIEEHKT